MSDADPLSRALECLGNGDSSGAADFCEQALRADDTDARAWHLRGVVHARGDDLKKAIHCFEQATKHDDDNSNYHYNLGLAFAKIGRVDRAIRCYKQAVDRKKDFLEARNNLGNALSAVGALEDAVDCFRDLVDDFPDSSDSHYNLANVLRDNEQVEESIVHYRRALQLDPTNSSAHENLGRALADEGREEEARQVWIEWLELEPDNAVARHMLAALSPDDAPDRCSDDYVRETFDQTFAKSFDQQLARLLYKAPELVVEAFAAVDREKHDLDVLDAGCGTGLCGPLLRGHSRRLVGVDLSEDMLAEARKRRTYDETVAAELTEYMTSNPRSFDLVVSADTFCYFGDLSAVLRPARECLKDDGLLVFTVECAETEPDAGTKPYLLQRNGRYRHAESYVRSSTSEAGFTVLKIERAVLRKERGRPVDGRVVTAACRTGAAP